MRSYKSKAFVVAAALFLSLFNVPLAKAEPVVDAAQCLSEGNTWVVVQSDENTIEGGCATSYHNGLVALDSAGFTFFTVHNVFVQSINGFPDANSAKPGYEWKNWQLKKQEDGSYSEWQPVSSRPQSGSVEGWRYQHKDSTEPPNFMPPGLDEDDSELNDNSVLPDGLIKDCWKIPGVTNPTFADTKKVTKAEFTNWCSKSFTPGKETVSDWTGYEFFPNLTDLEFYGIKRITDLPTNLGEMFPNLTSLSISSLTDTTLEGFSGLENLTKLKIDNTKLSSLGDLLPLPKLREASITNSKFTELDLYASTNLEKLNLRGNQFMTFADLKAHSVKNLNLRNNKLLMLAGVDKFSALESLDVRQNNIQNLMTLEWYPMPGLKEIDARDQLVENALIEAGKAYSLDTLLRVPKDVTVNWREVYAGQNLPALNTESGKFTVSKAFDWALAFDGGKDGVSYSGKVHGRATGDQKISVSIEGNKVVHNGDTLVLTAVVDPEFSSDVSYQWMTVSAPGEVTLLPGETSKTLTLTDMQLNQRGLRYAVEVTTDGGVFRSTPAVIEMRVKFDDPGFTKCFEDNLGKDWLAKDVWHWIPLDCSNRGIKSLDDLHKIWNMSNSRWFNFSGNEITDISPLIKDGELLDKAVDLSNNQISDLSPLADSMFDLQKYNLSTLYAKGLKLDGNQISDLSPLANWKLPSGDKIGISAKNQRINLPQVKVAEQFDLPQVLSADGSKLPLTHDGNTITNDQFKFEKPGSHEIAWQQPAGSGVAFDGKFSVTASMEPTLVATPDTAQPGEQIKVTGQGYHPNETVQVAIKDGAPLGEVTSNEVGAFEFSFEPKDLTGKVTIVASDKSGTSLSVDVTVLPDEEISIPDPDLQSCVREALNLEAGQPILKSQTEKFTGKFSCTDKAVSDLTGLEALKARQIDLSHNQISDLSKLVLQPNLRGLKLNENQILDFSPLAEFKGVDIEAYGQAVVAPPQVVGKPAPEFKYVGLSDCVEEGMIYPDTAEVADGSVTWTATGEHQTNFYLTCESGLDLRATGTITTRVIDASDQVLQVAPEEVYPGQLVNIVVIGMRPGEQVDFELHSDPVHLGSATADENGVATLSDVLIPADTEAGEHEVVATGADSGWEVSSTLSVKSLPDDVVITVPGEQPDTYTDDPKPDTQPDDPKPGTDPSATAPNDAHGLPKTGGSAGSLVLFGSLILAGFITAVSRRRN